MGSIGDCCCCCMQISEAPNWCINGMTVQFNWISTVQTSIDPQNRVYANRECCVEKTFRYQNTQTQIDTLGAEYYRDNYRFETEREVYGATIPNAFVCPTFSIVSNEKYVTQQIHRRVAVMRSRLADFIRIRVGKKKLPCRNDECRFVVSIYIDVDTQAGFIEQQWWRREFTRTGADPVSTIEETGNPTMWSAFVATSPLTRRTIVYVKEFDALPETLSFDSSDDWDCIQSPCNSDAPRQACITVNPHNTINPNPTNIAVQVINLPVFINGAGYYNPTWTNPNTSEVCQPPFQSRLIFDTVAPQNRRVDPHISRTNAFERMVAHNVTTDFFANPTSVCAPNPSISVVGCQAPNPNPGES